MAVVIVSLVNIIYPPSPCPRSDPACMSAHGPDLNQHGPDPHSNSDHILLGILLTLAAQGFQVMAASMLLDCQTEPICCQALLHEQIIRGLSCPAWEAS